MTTAPLFCVYALISLTHKGFRDSLFEKSESSAKFDCPTPQAIANFLPASHFDFGGQDQNNRDQPRTNVSGLIADCRYAGAALFNKLVRICKPVRPFP